MRLESYKTKSGRTVIYDDEKATGSLFKFIIILLVLAVLVKVAGFLEPVALWLGFHPEKENEVGGVVVLGGIPILAVWFLITRALMRWTLKSVWSVAFLVCLGVGNVVALISGAILDNFTEITRQNDPWRFLGACAMCLQCGFVIPWVVFKRQFRDEIEAERRALEKGED